MILLFVSVFTAVFLIPKMLQQVKSKLIFWKGKAEALFFTFRTLQWQEGGCLQPASFERLAKDVDPAAGTSSGQFACV